MELDLLEEAYRLLSDVDRFGADSAERRKRISKWIAKMESHITQRAADVASCSCELPPSAIPHCGRCGKPFKSQRR